MSAFIGEVRFNIIQDGDEQNTETQYMTVKAHAVGDNEFYYSISTKRWAVDDAKELSTLIKRIEKSINNLKPNNE